ncbi:MAG: tetratricopeptide repeat protein [Verrucomicrobiota bacterium]
MTTAEDIPTGLIKKESLHRIIRQTAQVTMRLPFRINDDKKGNILDDPDKLNLKKELSADDCRRLAHEQLGLNRPKCAAAYAKKAESLSSNPFEGCKLWTDIGNHCFDRNLLDEAINAFKWAYNLNPRVAATAFNLAVVLQVAEKYEMAKEKYELALKEDKDNAKLWCNLGVLYFQLNDIHEAEKATLRCLELRRNYTRAWDNLAGIFGAQRKYSESEEACYSAIAFDPDYKSSWLKLALIYYYEEDNMDKAEKAFETALGLGELDSMIKYHIAMIASRKNDIGHALTLCRDAVKVNDKADIGPKAWHTLKEAAQKNDDEETVKIADVTIKRLRELMV